jgi:hypothetical protein
MNLTRHYMFSLLAPLPVERGSTLRWRGQVASVIAVHGDRVALKGEDGSLSISTQADCAVALGWRAPAGPVSTEQEAGS